MIVLYVAGRWPWPVNVGRQRMIDQTLRLAAEIAEVHLLAFSAAEASEIEYPAHIRSAGLLKPSGKADIAKSLAAAPGRPLQCHLFNSAAARRDLLAAVERIRPDVLVVDMLRLFPLAEAVRKAHPNIRIVLDMDDMLSVRYARMLAAPKLAHVAGTFERKLPAPLRVLARSAPRTLVKVERPRMAKLERDAYRAADAILMVSPTEAAKLNAENGGAKALGFPPLIDQRPSLPHRHDASLRFVFIGNANYAPNAEALLLLDRAAARLKGQGGVPHTFEIAGVSNPGLSLPNLQLKGFVPDLSAFLSGDAVLVAPILTGTGVKTKIVDALEHATPIVTTDVGAEGLPLVAGDHFIRVGNEDDLVAALSRLLADAGSRAALAGMGQAALDRCFASANHAVLLATLKRALGAA